MSEATYRLRSGLLTPFHQDQITAAADIFQAYTGQPIDEDVVARMLCASRAWEEQRDHEEREHYYRSEISARENAALLAVHERIRARG